MYRIHYETRKFQSENFIKGLLRRSTSAPDELSTERAFYIYHCIIFAFVFPLSYFHSNVLYGIKLFILCDAKSRVQMNRRYAHGTSARRVVKTLAFVASYAADGIMIQSITFDIHRNVQHIERHGAGSRRSSRNVNFFFSKILPTVWQHCVFFVRACARTHTPRRSLLLYCGIRYNIYVVSIEFTRRAL